MPNVPYNPIPGVAPGQRPDASLSVQAPLQAFGGGDEANQAYGQAHALSQDAFHIAMATQDQNDLADVMKATAALTDYATDAQFNPETGFLAKKGDGARNLQAPVREGFTKQVSALSEGLKNDRQREMFQTKADERWAHMNTVLGSHMLQERQNYISQQTKAFVDSETDAAKSAALIGDMGRIDQAAKNVETGTHAWAAKNGVSPEVADLVQAQDVSKVYRGSIEAMLDAGGDLVGKQQFEKVQDKLTGEDKAHLTKLIETASYRGEAQREVANIFAPKRNGESVGGILGSLGVNKFGEAPTEKETYAQVDQIKDPKLQDMVRERVRERWADTKRVDAEAAKDDLLQAANIIEGKPDLDAIPPALFDRLPLTARRALQDRAKQIKAGEAPPALSDRYFELLKESGEHPDKFIKRDLTAERSNIAGPELKQLSEDQAKILKGDGNAAMKARGFLGMQEDATLTLKGMGVTDQNDINNFLRGLNRDYVAWKADPKNAGKEPEEDQMQDMIGKYIKQDRVWYKLWLGTAPKLHADDYVTRYDEIPAGEKAAIESQLKKAGESPTKGRVVELYGKGQKK